MTYQCSPKRLGFRELNAFELDAVSGGNTPLIYPGGMTLFGGTTAGTSSSGSYSVGNGDGAGGLGSGLSAFQVPIDFAALAALATVDWEAFRENLKNIDWTLPPQDLDGDGDPGITVTGEKFKAPDGYTLGPVNPSTGLIHIMYLNGPDGRPDISKPPVLTPDGEKFACDAYEEGMKAVDQTMGQSGTAATLTGILYGNAGLLPLIGGIAGLTTTYSAPAHCP